MFFTENLARLGILAFTGLSAIIYAYSSKSGITQLARLISLFFAIYALFNVLFVALLCLNHINAPLGLGPLESSLLEGVKRALSWQSIYPEPSPEYVPFAYNPLYYLLCVPFAWLFGANLSTLRLITILGTVGAAIIIFLSLRRATGSNWWSLMTIGLFSAAYSVMDSAHDRIHPDSWLLFTVLLGCYLIDQNRSQTTNLLGVLSMVTAFWFKQHGALLAIGALIFLTWRDGWRKSWLFWLLALVLGPGLYLAAPWLLGPRFHYFTWEVPHQWTELNRETIERLVRFIAQFYFVLAILSFITSAFVLLRKRQNSSIWYFMLPIAVLSGFMGALDPGSSNNVFLLMGVWLIITGVLGLKQFIDRFAVAKQGGLHLIAFGVSFTLFLYNPMNAIISPHATTAYQDMICYLKSLDGSVYAPMIGQLQNGYKFYPAVHEIALEDIIRGPGVDEQNHPTARKLLEAVLNPQGPAYILAYYPLAQDSLLAFLKEKYLLDADLGARFAALTPLKTGRFAISWPRYLYKYSSQNSFSARK